MGTGSALWSQIITFTGPRSAEQVAASARAGREHLEPLIEANTELRDRLLGGFRAVAPDGAECVVTFAHDSGALDELAELVHTSELLPGEDPGLLPGPDRVDFYSSVDLFGTIAASWPQGRYHHGSDSAIGLGTHAGPPAGGPVHTSVEIIPQYL